jgi:hypothetical protein
MSKQLNRLTRAQYRALENYIEEQSVDGEVSMTVDEVVPKAIVALGHSVSAVQVRAAGDIVGVNFKTKQRMTKAREQLIELEARVAKLERLILVGPSARAVASQQ